MCEDIIDSQPFNNTVYRVYNKDKIYHYDSKTDAPYYEEHNYSDAAHTHYANDYATSSIRTWLNNDFYNTAFSAADKTAVATSTVDGNNDKVYLLSKSEAEAQYTGTPKGGTDYAQCQGYYSFDHNEWMTRTARTGTWYGEEVDFGSYVYNIYVTLSPTKDDVYYTGNTTNHVCETYNGIRPVLKLNLHTHDYTYKTTVTKPATHTSAGQKIGQCICGATQKGRIPTLRDHNFVVASTTPATCTEPGVINYTCVCGATDTKTIDPTGHHHSVTATTPSTCSVAGSTTYTCACGDTYTVDLPLAEHTFNGPICSACGYDKADDCSCNCHKSGISKFFFSIMLFFQKLFGNNKVCSCGHNHY